jgi:N-methylhydantoinase A
VTDAQVVLGYLGEEGLAGGELLLDAGAAHRALERLGEAVGLRVSDAARGVLRIVRATMARAVRSVSIERGKDVRDYALVAFGGAGPLHATALASELGMTTVLVPQAPGALAALGLLVASRRADASLSRPGLADRSRDVELRSMLHELTESVLDDLRAEGVSFAQARIEHFVDCRYEGQSHELRVPVAGGPSFALVGEAFHAAHKERFGFERRDASVEAVTFRASAIGPPGNVVTRPLAGGDATTASSRVVDEVEVPVFDRASLPAGASINGPAIVREIDSTTWIDTGWTGVVHESGALVLTSNKAAERAD